MSPEWCLAQRDAAAILASAFNRDTFALFDSSNFEPSALSQEGEIRSAEPDDIPSLKKCAVVKAEKSASYLEKESYADRYQICKDSERLAAILATEKRKGSTGPRLPRVGISANRKRRRSIHKKVMKAVLKKSRRSR